MQAAPAPGHLHPFAYATVRETHRQEIGSCRVIAYRLSPDWPLDETFGRLVYCVLRLFVDRHDALALRIWLGLQQGIGTKTIAGISRVLPGAKAQPMDGLAVLSESWPCVRWQRSEAQVEKSALLLEQLQSLATLQKFWMCCLSRTLPRVAPQAYKVRSVLQQLIRDESIQTTEELVRVLQTYDIQAEHNCKRMPFMS